jgi:hypothetical protein
VEKSSASFRKRLVPSLRHRLESVCSGQPFAVSDSSVYNPLRAAGDSDSYYTGDIIGSYSLNWTALEHEKTLKEHLSGEDSVAWGRKG